MTDEWARRKARRWTTYGVVCFVVILLALAFAQHPIKLRAAKRAKATSECAAIQAAIIGYRAEFNSLPDATDNRSLIKTLTSGNPRRIAFISLNPKQLDSEGEMIDPWGTPYRISIVSASEIHVSSAGPDKVFGTSDDLPSP